MATISKEEFDAKQAEKAAESPLKLRKMVVRGNCHVAHPITKKRLTGGDFIEVPEADLRRYLPVAYDPDDKATYPASNRMGGLGTQPPPPEVQPHVAIRA